MSYICIKNTVVPMKLSLVPTNKHGSIIVLIVDEVMSDHLVAHLKLGQFLTTTPFLCDTPCNINTHAACWRNKR